MITQPEQNGIAPTCGQNKLAMAQTSTGFRSFAVWLCLLVQIYAESVLADTLVLSSGRSISGTIVRTNGDTILLVTDYSVYNFHKESIKEIKASEQELPQSQSAKRLAALRQIVPLLAGESWASELRPIPATVIDQGVMRNVPYISLRCGEDYEVNIYGDPSHPAGIEAGVYHGLTSDDTAKRNCISFVAKLLGRSDDKQTLWLLHTDKDLHSENGLTFEVTPPSAPDAYQGWWISVYSEEELNHSRASDAEMKHISVPRAVILETPAKNDAWAWTPSDLKFARQDPGRISFTTKSGLNVTNAEVKVYREGASLIWRTGTVGGVVKLADLPEDLQARFNYDPAKAAAVEAQEQAQRDANAAALAAAAAATPTPAAAPTAPDYGLNSYFPSDSSGGYSGGSVYVHGYYRSNGTYVQSYTRRR